MMRMLDKLVTGLEGEDGEAQGGMGGVGLVVHYGKDGFSSDDFRVSREMTFRVLAAHHPDAGLPETRDCSCIRRSGFGGSDSQC